MERGSAVDHVVPSPNVVAHARPIERETVEIPLIHAVHELLEGMRDDEVLGAISNEPTDVLPVAEHQSCDEGESTLSAECGHVRRAGRAELSNGDLPVHHLPRILTLLAEHDSHQL